MTEQFDVEWAVDQAAEEADRQRKREPPPVLEEGDYLAWRAPKIVDQSPTRLDHPLWHWLVRTRWSAYQANELFFGPSSTSAGPCWCFDRFGMSATTLPDGRVVHIAGEHEDHYDADFYIYNDVIVVAPDGTIAIYGYARKDFAPTDFHTATLVDGQIVIIGCLGYPDQRVIGTTPVYALDVDTMAIRRIDATGEAPGWIHRHSAQFIADTASVLVRGGKVTHRVDLPDIENLDTWRLDVRTWQWTRLTDTRSIQWTLLRVDRGANRLWDTRHDLWHQQNAWEGLERHWSHPEAPDFDALAELYRVEPGVQVVQDDQDSRVFHIQLHGARVKFTEGGNHVQVLIVGQLADDVLERLQHTTLATLARIDKSPWEVAE